MILAEILNSLILFSVLLVVTPLLVHSTLSNYTFSVQHLYSSHLSGLTGPNNYTFQIRNYFTCTSTYTISCTKCNLIYIGETKRRLADRFTELSWLYQLLNTFTDNHSKDHIKVTAIVQCSSTDDISKEKEQRIIHLLGTLHPAGLNISFTAFVHMQLCWCSSRLHYSNVLQLYVVYYRVLLAYLIQLQKKKNHVQETELWDRWVIADIRKKYT